MRHNAAQRLLLIACVSALAASKLPTATSQQAPVPDILGPGAPVIWQDLVGVLWDILLQNDIEETCNSNNCPCPGFNGQRFGNRPEQCRVAQTGARCGGISRVWARMLFHDCGTFDVNDFTGGCDGSLQFELDRPENGAGMPEAIDAYRGAIATTMAMPQNAGRPRPSMADTIIAAGLLGFAKCGAPIILFTPGRRDAAGPNRPGLLPNPTEGLGAILAKMARASLSPVETVILVGAGHTMSKLHGRNLDGTPDRFDNRFFAELASRAGRKLPSDLVMLDDDEMLDSILRFANNNDEFMDEAAFAIDKMVNLVPVARRSSPPPPPPPVGSNPPPPPPPPPVARRPPPPPPPPPRRPRFCIFFFCF